jgi:hypothetical protein
MGTIFISIILTSSFEMRDLFERAKSKKLLLDKFENSTSTKLTVTKLFGNDMLEKNIEIQSDDYTEDGLNTSRYVKSILFTSITPRFPDNGASSVGTPFCSTDFIKNNIIGLSLYGKVNYRNVNVEAIVLPIDPLLPLTDIEVRNGIAYISADSTKSTDPDIFIIDIQDKNQPEILSSLNTGPGLSAVAVAGKRIYASSASTAYQLHTIYMNNLNSLSLENKFALALPFATATRSFGSSIFYRNGFIYLGTEKWDGDEFSIIDVHDPMTPSKIGSFEIGSKINDIFVTDQYVYLADSDELQFRILDIENATNPILHNSFSQSGFNRQEGKIVSNFENDIVFGRTSGGFDIVKDHELYSFASTSSTTLAQFTSLNIPGGLYGSISDRNFHYLATREIDKEFQILRKADLSKNLFENSTSTKNIFSLPVAPETMTCDGDNLYILAHLSPVIYHIYFR